ncbi:adhesion G-protein coupled receptor G2-like [Huso huso]|uniref:Adhesion G-protein coupled receptor G2-like n=1 Tax=Huso huso TaxID=61971 RepID=A0ABR0YXA9_HUSHU
MSESLQKQDKDFLSKISKCDKKSVEQCNDVVSSISKAIKNILTDKTAFNGPKKEINFTGFYGIVAKYNITDKKPLLIPLPLQDTHSVEIKLTLEALQQASGHNNDSSQYGVGRFLNSNLFPDEQNSSLLSDEVIAIELGSPISDLTDNITITFYHADTLQENVLVKCAFWDLIQNGTKAIWNDSGCQTFGDKNKTVCSCNHLTYFAVLMNPNNITLSASTLKALTYISYIGCGVSLFFLGVVLFMYFILWKQKSDDSTTIHQSLCSALFLLNLTFLLNEWLASYNNDGLCQFIAALMHYSLLCTFTWFGIEAFHLYLLMIKVFNSFIKHYRMKLSLAGWGIPAVPVILSRSLNKYGKYSISTEQKSVSMCWLTEPAVLYFTIGYFAVLFLFNAVIFTKVTVKVVQLRRAGAPKKSISRRELHTVLGMACLLGITWGVMFFNFGPLQEPALYAFSILNSLHGFFLFLRYWNSAKTRRSTEKLDQTRTDTVLTSNPTSTVVNETGIETYFE